MANTRRKPTEAEKIRLRKAIAAESKPESIAANVAKIQKLRAAKQQHSGSIAQRVLDLLRQRKDAEHLSLNDLQARTGIDSGNLSRLLNSDEPNLTLETVERLATAMHCTVHVTLQPDK